MFLYIFITCVIAFTINFLRKGRPDIINNEKVLILGASSGIGKAIALEYAARNANILLAARRVDRLEQVKKECLEISPSKIVDIVKCDITNEEDLKEVVIKIKRDFGVLNTVIVNSGVINVLKFEDLINNDNPNVIGSESESSKSIDTIFKTNTYGPIYCAKYFIPLLKETKGRFVVVSSVSGRIGAPTRALYSASKHALMGFFNSLRMEIADSGVSITLVCPGSVSDTDLRTSAIDITKKPNSDVQDGANPLPKNKKSLLSFLKITPKQCAQAVVEASDWRKKESVVPSIYNIAILVNTFAPGIVELGAKMKYHFKK